MIGVPTASHRLRCATRVGIAICAFIAFCSQFAHSRALEDGTRPPFPMVGEQTALDVRSAATPSQVVTGCPASLTIPMTSQFVASRWNAQDSVTELFCGDAPSDCVRRFAVTPELAWSSSCLPIKWGLAWIAQDLDLDGSYDLVLQRGDGGFGGNGYLDIYRSSDWALRARFTFPGMKGWMYPRAVNVDSDPFPEIFVTLNGGFGGVAQAVIIDFDPVADTFRIMSQVDVPINFGGPPGIADFDDDGNLEFVCGGLDGYGLVELRDTTLYFIGIIDSTPGNNNAAAASRPYADNSLRLLLSHAVTETYWVDVLKSTGDNSFEIERTLADTTGHTGYSNVISCDTDCDSLDEFVGTFIPSWVEWGWDATTGSFESHCEWGIGDYPGALGQWYSMDLDRNGRPEWCAIGNVQIFYVFPDPNCTNCDSLGRCPTKEDTPPCYCPCADDPVCDHTVSDVVDVVTSISVAFRGAPSVSDPYCPRARTDVDCDALTTVLDVVKTINVAFRGMPAAQEYCAPCQ